MADDSSSMGSENTDANITSKENRDSPAPSQQAIKKDIAENRDSQKDKVSINSSGKAGNEIPQKDIQQKSTHGRPLQSPSENRKNDAVANSADVTVSPKQAIETYKQNAPVSTPSSAPKPQTKTTPTNKIETAGEKRPSRKTHTSPITTEAGTNEKVSKQLAESSEVKAPGSLEEKKFSGDDLKDKSQSEIEQTPVEQEAQEPPKPEWKVLEPEDRTDAVEHEIYEDKKLYNGWKIVAASVRGKFHAHKGIWRDDAYAYGQVDDWTIVAVSDGAGSAKISRVGARIACEEAVDSLKEMLSNYRLEDGQDGAPSKSDQRRLKAFLTLSACAARDGIVREAHKRNVETSDMYATLLLIIHSKWKDRDLVGAFQIGDGAMGVLDKEKKCTVVGVADHGPAGSETVFLTSWNQLIKAPYDHRVVLRIFTKPVYSMAVMCDGVADDFFPEEKRLQDLFIGNPISYLKDKEGNELHGVLRTVIKKPQAGEVLKEWLRYEKRGSSDDRTLVLLHKE